MARLTGKAFEERLHAGDPHARSGMYGKAFLAAALAARLVAAFGGQDVVTASSFGWNPTDATACLQAAFDSGAKKVVVDRQASEWLVETVYPRSDTEIVFADGVVVRAKPGTEDVKAEFTPAIRHSC